MPYRYHTPAGRTVEAGSLGDAQAALIDQLQPLLQGGTISHEEYQLELGNLSADGKTIEGGLVRDEESTRTEVEAAQAALAEKDAEIARLKAQLEESARAQTKELAKDPKAIKGHPLMAVAGMTPEMIRALDAADIVDPEELGGTPIPKVRAIFKNLDDAGAKALIQAARDAAGPG